MLLPVAAALVLFGGDGFYLLTELRLAGQVLLFLGTDALEVLLMALVDDGAGGLETVPDLFTLFLGHGTDLTVFLMQFLQLVEGANDVGLLGQFLGSLTEALLLFLVLAEVVFAGFAVQAQHVVELLDVELVVAPQLAGFLGRNVLYLAPLLLQGLEILIALIGLFRGGDHGLDLLNDTEFLGQVLLLLGFLLLEDLGTLLLDDDHLGLEGFFLLIGSNLVFLRISATVHIRFETGFALCQMQLVEGGLQVVHLLFLGSIVAMGDLPDTFQNLGFGLVDLARGFYLRSHLLGRCLLWLLGYFFLHHFVVARFLAWRDGCADDRGILLRVHHLTSVIDTIHYYDAPRHHIWAQRY